MRNLWWMLALLMLAPGCAGGHDGPSDSFPVDGRPVVEIMYSLGGALPATETRLNVAAIRGSRFHVTHTCASACTAVLYDRFAGRSCWEASALFVFHAVAGPDGRYSAEATRQYADALPVALRENLPPAEQWAVEPPYILRTGAQLHTILGRGQCQ